MNTTLRLLGFEPERWRSPAIAAYGSAWFTVVAASVVIAITRFGGALVDEPRAFVRLILVPVWGWLGLAVAVWLIGTGLGFARRDILGVRTVVATVGLAHSALLVFGFVVLMFGGLFEVLGPGAVARVFVFAVWFPALLIASTAWSHRIPIGVAALAVVPSYFGWWFVVGAHVTSRIAHLL